MHVAVMDQDYDCEYYAAQTSKAKRYITKKCAVTSSPTSSCAYVIANAGLTFTIIMLAHYKACAHLRRQTPHITKPHFNNLCNLISTAITKTARSCSFRSTIAREEQPFRFLDLPAELRLMVYESLPTKITHHDLRISREAHGEQGCLTLVWTTLSGLAVLRTCRQTNSEAKKIIRESYNQGPARPHYCYH
jgi:hypothetical protein